MTPIITDKIKQLPDGVIKLPVDYSDRAIFDADDSMILHLFPNPTIRHETGEYIATCINEHARLVSELETAKRALEAARIALTSGLHCTCSTEQCEVCAKEMDTALAEVQAALKSEK